MSKKNNIIWTLISLFLSVFIFSKIQELFKINSDSTFQGVRSFYKEQQGSLDAVVIGGSDVHAFWQPSLAWTDYGMAVYSFSIDSLRAAAVTFLMDEIRKTQPQTLFIINLGMLKKVVPIPDTEVHRTTNYLPFSVNKLKSIYYLANYGGFKGLDQLEFYFPIIRFHSSWSQLSRWKFTKRIDGTKHSLKYKPYLKQSADQSKGYDIIEEETDITEEQNAFLSKILDYCDEYQLNVLFINSPQSLGKNSLFYKQINRMQRIVQERGYLCLDMHKAADEMGLQMATDFYNNKHTNVHGSIKYTDYLARNLKAIYGFTDKRGMQGWESWDRSAELYTDVIGPYTLPIERSHEKRDYDLSAPIMDMPLVEGSWVTLNWTPSADAEFYEIFRKSSEPGKANWVSYNMIDGNSHSYVDRGLENNVNYTYTVVPGYTVGGVKYYGKFDYTGVTGKIR